MMNLFARILSHAFGLIIVALLAIGLIYRGELFPEWELPDFLAFDSAPEETTEAASGDVQRIAEANDVAADKAAAELAEVEPVPAPVEAAPEMAEAETVPAPVEAAPEMAEAETVPAPVEAAPEMAEAEAEVVPAPVEAAPEMAEAEAVPAEAQPEETKAEAAEPEATAIEKPADATQAPDTGPGVEAPAAPASAASSYRLLASAREAYWLRDYALAEEKYQQLIALEPNNPDGYGELGNMYFSRGAWEQAAAAYYEAGVRLVDQGHMREARQLVDVIRGLNGPQADTLEQKIQSAGQ